MQPSEQYEAGNGFTVSLQAEESESSPQQYSARPTGTAFRRLMADAMEQSEFSESQVGGIPVRRQGQGLRIGYDSALELLGFGNTAEYE